MNPIKTHLSNRNLNYSHTVAVFQPRLSCNAAQTLDARLEVMAHYTLYISNNDEKSKSRTDSISSAAYNERKSNAPVVRYTTATNRTII